MRLRGIEPIYPGWKPSSLPLGHNRKMSLMGFEPMPGAREAPMLDLTTPQGRNGDGGS